MTTTRAARARHVDIGLPVYNGERYLAVALDSLLAQTHEDLSVWISDNGSTDATSEIARDYASRDPRVHSVRHPVNAGAAWNFNHVRRFATGPYFKWAAHDDIHAPTYLERCLEVLEQVPDAIVAQPRTVFIDDLGQELLRSFRINDWDSPRPAERLWTALGRNHEYAMPYGLMRTSVVTELADFAARYGADELFVAELALRGRLIEVDEHLFENRLHPNRSMVQNTGLRYRLLWNGFWSGGPGGGSSFPTWRFLRDLRGTIARVPLSPLDRRACDAVVLRWIRANSVRLGLDVPLGVEHVIRGRWGAGRAVRATRRNPPT